MRNRLRRPAAVAGVTCVVLAGAGLSGWLVGRWSRQLLVSPPGEAVALSALPGLDRDDLSAFFEVFKASCAHRDAEAPPVLQSICADATGPSAPTAQADIRGFLARRFVPRRLTPAFFTGYYEPVVEASPVATARFKTPLLEAPADLVTVRAGATPELDPALTAALRGADGTLRPLPDRAGIETGALGADGTPIAFVESSVDAFFIQVQGSARLKMPDGTLRRLVYAGRNGYPYTAIGRVLVSRTGIDPARMGMAQLKTWIRDHGQNEGEEGSRLMRENRSFIFFRFDDARSPDLGPAGAQGVGLTARRSLAVDHAVWPYGLPFYIDTVAADGKPLQALTVGQDTGAAIKGAARADIFFGTGAAAAVAAGAQRAGGTLYALWPNEDPAP